MSTFKLSRKEKRFTILHMEAILWQTRAQDLSQPYNNHYKENEMTEEEYAAESSVMIIDIEGYKARKNSLNSMIEAFGETRALELDAQVLELMAPVLQTLGLKIDHQMIP